MPWARLDDKANDNPKLRMLSDSAWRLWGCGLIYCQAHLSDGFIPDGMIHEFGVKARNVKAVAAELCTPNVPGAAPLWFKVEGGYRINDYLDWNDSRDAILDARAKAKERLERHRKKGRLPHIPNASVNAICNAVSNAMRNGEETPPVQLSTYHVPPDVPVPTEVLEKQEHAPPGANASLEHVRVRMLRRQRSRETLDGKPAKRVITALARHILESHPDYDEGELMEAVKAQCARANLEYAGVAGEAIDRARAQLARRQRQEVAG